MDGKTHQPAAKSRSVIKPISLHHYVDEFERLYQRSPMAKMLIQESVGRSPTPQKFRFPGNPTIRSPVPRGLKVCKPLPKSTSGNSCLPLPLPQTDLDHNAQEDGMILHVDSGSESKYPLRRDHVLANTGGDSELVKGESFLSEEEPDIAKKSFVSSHPRFQTPLGALKGARKAPNLHNLIKRLASPRKGKTLESTEVPNSKTMSEGESLECVTGDANSGGLSQNLALDNGSKLESGQLKSKSQVNVDDRSMYCPEETPVPCFTDGKGQPLPQRRLLKIHSPSNQNHLDHLLNTPAQISWVQTTPARAQPNSNNSPRLDNNLENGFLTPKSLPVSDLDPASGPSLNEQAVSLFDTPVNRQASVRKTRSKGHDIGNIIHSLQKSGRPRFEIPYTDSPDRRSPDGKENLPKDEEPVLNDAPVQENLNKSNKIHERQARRRDRNDRTLSSETESTDTEKVNGVTYREPSEAEMSSDRNARDTTEEPPTLDKPIHRRSSPKKNQNISQEKPETIINRWIIKPVPSSREVCVEGHRVGDKGDQYWHSTAIMVRVGPRLVATKTGSLYRLTGKMNRALTMEQGFSESVVRSFQHGFPANWRELLHDHFVDKDKKKTAESPRKPASKKKKSEASPMPGPKKVDHSAAGSEQKAKKNMEVHKTPQNLRVRDLQRSSSGRLIKPPLAYWTGQRVRHNRSLDFVEILQGTEDCTSLSVNQISLQDSLEAAPSTEKKSVRSTKNNKLQKSLTGGKKTGRSKKIDTGSDGSLTPSVGSETETMDSEDQQDKQMASQTNGRGPKGRGKSTFRERKLKNKKEERREGRDTVSNPSDVVSSSPDHRGTSSAGAVTESSLSTSASNRGEINRSAEGIVMHTVSRDCRLPPRPQKLKAKERLQRKAPLKCGAPVSPLYYHPSVESEEDSTGKGCLSAVRQTAVGTNETSGGVFQPLSDQRCSMESSDTDTAPQEEQRSRQTIAKTNPKRSDGILNLQEEVLAVVEKHKKSRMAQMKERSSRIRSSSGGNTQPQKSGSTFDVFELSDDEKVPRAKRIPYRPQGLSTTSDELVSNWSEEGDKSVNMTWVTRGGPKRRVYGALEDPSYKTPETTETTTTTSTETEAIVNPLSSSKDPTGSICDESLSDLQNKSQRSSSRNLRGRRTRKVHKSLRDNLTSTDENMQPSKKATATRNTRSRTMKIRNQVPESSSEGTDDTLVSQDMITSSEDTYTTVQPKKATVSKGHSKKAVIVQRHQPSRSCKKNESDSEMGTIAAQAQNGTYSATIQRDTQGHCLLNQKRGDAGSHREEQEESGNTTSVSEPKKVQRQTFKSRKSNKREENTVECEEPTQEVMIDGNLRNPEKVQDPQDLNLVQSSSESDKAKDGRVTKEQLTAQSTEQDGQVQPTVTLTAKVGTMKRKRQLRELVEQHNRGYEDDIFESTPFKKQKKRKIPLGEWDVEDERQDYEVSGKTPGSARFKTPSTRYHGVPPLSDKKTPYSNLISPGLLPSVDRKHVDQYIHALQKKKGRCLGQGAYRAKKPTSLAMKDRPRAGSETLTQAIKERMADVFDVTPMSESDPDEDGDYYWSDDEN